MLSYTFDVIVVGGGHGGCEAAHASAKMGCKTLLLTMAMDTVGVMSCNPSIGGLAKGQIAREVDALGGLMGRIIDRSMIHFRMLNASKGAAVQAPRAQADKKLYQTLIKHEVEKTPNLVLAQGSVIDIRVNDNRVTAVRTREGIEYKGKSIILTTGTFLKGLIHMGTAMIESGRAGESASHLPDCFKSLGLITGRLKTGTPPRILSSSIDYSQLTPQPSEPPLPFSYWSGPINRPLVDCYIGYTNQTVHDIILENIHLSPMYSGQIHGVGPRYCPSIEDKVKRFKEKERHQLFFEPEGLNTEEVYINGVSTSLPPEVQDKFLRTIPGLENLIIQRFGYAVEYDYVPPYQTSITLMSKHLPGLFFAGQINGTSGYEEAAGQGLIAGINAALHAKGEEPFIMDRSDSLIGVMLDDLTTKELDEPYRMFTSRAEYRLTLRQDNADRRLYQKARKYNLITQEQFDMVQRKIDNLLNLRKTFDKKYVDGKTLTHHVRVNSNTIDDVLAIAGDLGDLPDRETLLQFDIDTKYEGYLKRQDEEIIKHKRVENKPLSPENDYLKIKELKMETKQKLNKFKPATIGQASRLSGVNPADISILLVLLEKGDIKS